MRSLIDFHTHYFSRSFFQSLAKRSPLPGDEEDRLTYVARETKLELPPQDEDEHLQRWLGQMDEFGLQHMVTFASSPEEADTVARAVRAAGGRLSGFCVIDPTAEGAAKRTAKLLGADGFRGLLLFPAMHHYALDGPECEAIAAVAETHRAPMVVHCGVLRIDLRDRFGLPRGYQPSLANPLDLVPLANRHRGATFVLPHFGAGFFREALMAGQMCENIWVDTSSSNNWMANQPSRLTLADVFERAVGVFGPERILFGTDSSTFPRGWRHDIFTAQREALGACSVSEEGRLRIFQKNAAELLGVGEVAQRTH